MLLAPICSCLALLVLLFGPLVWLKVRDAWADVTTEDEGRWASLAERERWSR